jgi:hypothetical protein
MRYAAMRLAMGALFILAGLIGTQAAQVKAAYDLDAAAAAFNANKGKLTTSVLKGWSGNDSKVAEYSVERIMDRTAWSAAWARHAPDTKVPDVDFSTAMVIAIFAGPIRTSIVPDIGLDSVTEDDKIEVTTMNYVYDVIREEQKNLYLFVVLQRSVKAVRVFARSYALMRTPQEETILMKEFEALSPPK